MHAKSTLVMTVFVVTVFTVSGCYTKLMTPQEFVHSQRYQSKRTFSDNSYAVNYNQSCVTCHSVMELTERSEELDYYGVRTVHDGIVISNSLWLETSIILPIQPLPGPYWPNPYNPVGPWWNPQTTSVTSTTAVKLQPEERRRQGGSTSISSEETKRQNDAVPSYTPPPPKVETIASPPPAASVNSPKTQSTPQGTEDDGRRKKIPD